MPYSPDYSDYVKFKRQQTALAVNRQIDQNKKKLALPFSSYDPAYSILSYPPNIFTPSRLIPQPSPLTPQVTYDLIIDIQNNAFSGQLTITSGLNFQQNVTTLRVSFINAPTIANWFYVNLENKTYDFTGTTVTFENPGGGGGIIITDVNGNIIIDGNQQILQPSSVIIYTLPTPLQYLQQVTLSSV